MGFNIKYLSGNISDYQINETHINGIITHYELWLNINDRLPSGELT